MEDSIKHLNDQQKKKEKLYESTLEEGEICKFPKSRFLHNKIIITDDNNKEKNFKENNKFQSKIYEDSNKIENTEIKENKDNQIINDENQSKVTFKCSDVIENVVPYLPLDLDEMMNDIHTIPAAPKITSCETINNKSTEEVYSEKLNNQNDVDNQKGCLNETKSEHQEFQNKREREEIRDSAIFTIPMDIDREIDNNVISNKKSSEDYNLDFEKVKNEEHLITEKKEEDSKIENRIDAAYSSGQIEEKSSLNIIKTSVLTEDQILENKEILNNKNFLINNDSPNLDEVKKNYIKIKILDDEKIEEEGEEENIQTEKEQGKIVNSTSNVKYQESLKNEIMDLNEKEEIVNKPIIEPIEKIKNIALLDDKKIALEYTPEKKQYVIQNTENTNITYNQINITEKKSNSAKDNYESDRDIISNLISYKNPVLLKFNNTKNPTNSTEKLNSNNSANSKNDSNDKQNINNDYNSPKQTNMQTNLKQDLNKEKQNNDELTSENLEEKNDNNATKDKNNQTKDNEKEKEKDKDKDKDKDKKLSKKCEKKMSSKNCIYCKVEITDASSILKFKSSDDFLTYCKLFFEKLPPQKKEVYAKSIASFEKYYTEKYSNFEQINNIIFKSIKSICKICYEENIKEENGFINILAALNYNIIINNKRNQTGSANNSNNNLANTYSSLKKESISLELNENNNSSLVKPNTVETPKMNINENNKELISSANKNINKNVKSNANALEIETSQISVENVSMKNTANAKREIVNDFEKQMGIKKNSINSESEVSNNEKAKSHPSHWNPSIKISNDSSIYIANNDLLGRKQNRNEQELIGMLQKKSTFYENKLNQNNSENNEVAYLNRNSTQSNNTVTNANYGNVINNPNSIANTQGENVIDESYNRNFTQSKTINNDGNLANKNNLNSNLNMNTKNISLENLNITNVFMNFDQKKGLKPILIDSKISNNENPINNNTKLNLNNNNNLQKQEELIAMTKSNLESNQNLLEDLKKNYIDLNNCSLEKKLFLNSLQKKSELLINNLSDFDKNKQQGIYSEHNYMINNNNFNELENEKKNFALNNSKQMGLLMNSINQQLEENKSLIYPMQKIEIKEIPNATQIGSLLMEQYNQADKTNQQVQYLNAKNAVGNEYESIVNNNSFGLNNNSCTHIHNNLHVGNNKIPSSLTRSENINLNGNQDNNQLLIAAHNMSHNSEKENQFKNHKTNLIDRILNPNSVNSKNANNNITKSNTANQNLMDLSGKNSITNTDASNKINNNMNNNNMIINENNNKKLEENINSMNNNSNMQQQKLNPLLNELLSSPNSNLNNYNRISLQQMLLNQNPQIQGNINNNNNNNNNLHLQGSLMLNNSSAANLEAKKQLSEQAALGNLNLNHHNLLMAQNNQLINQTLSGMVQNPMNFGLTNSSLLPGLQNIQNLQSQLNQHIANLNPLMQLNANLLGNLDPQSFLLQNNLLNQNQMDLGVLALNNNGLMQLPLPLSYQLQMQMQMNPSLGLQLSLPMQIQNQMQLGNFCNMQLGNLNQMELLNKLNMGAPNLQALQQQQQMNILQSNYPQQHLIQAGNSLELSLQHQNLLKSVNNNNINTNAFQHQKMNIEHLRSQEMANTLNQLNQFEKNQIQNLNNSDQPDQSSSQIEQNRIHNQSAVDLALKNQEQNRNLLNSNHPNNQLNLNLNQMIMQNGQNNHLIYNQAILNQLSNQNLNYLNSKMHSEE